MENKARTLWAKKPSDSEAFERMVCVYAENTYGQKFALYGRSGQRQNGADIISENRDYIIQCKNVSHIGANEINKIKKDYHDACEHFKKMRHFIIATALDGNDTRLQDEMYKLREEKTGSSEVEIKIEHVSWIDIIKFYGEHLDLAEKFFVISDVNNEAVMIYLGFWGMKLRRVIEYVREDNMFTPEDVDNVVEVLIKGLHLFPESPKQKSCIKKLEKIKEKDPFTDEESFDEVCKLANELSYSLSGLEDTIKGILQKSFLLGRYLSLEVSSHNEVQTNIRKRKRKIRTLLKWIDISLLEDDVVKDFFEKISKTPEEAMLQLFDYLLYEYF